MAQSAKNILGTEKIGSLLLKFTIPSIVAMLVSSLYNIVDQFFIGRSVGVLGNAATNVAFPLTITYVAISLLCGIGGAANFNLSMGRGKPEQAEKFAGGAISMMVVLGALLCLTAQLFLKPLMVAFGATDRVLEYAMTYTGITSWGFPAVILTTGGSHLVRADGSPRYSMICTLSGAAINTVLDYLFVFRFDFGIAGAAYATVIGQTVSALMIVWHLAHFRTVPLRAAALKPSLWAWKKITSLGIAPFFNQISMMVVQIVLNNSLIHYGGLSAYGSDVPLACAGIISKVNMIFFSIVIGISQGLQPIISFNYGAEKYARVREAYRKAVTAAIIISTVGFALFQLFPRQIIGIFGDGNESYYLFAEKFFRIYLFCTFINGVQPITANLFTGIGKAKKGMFVSLTRQIIFLLPLLLVLPLLMGIEGVMFAAPISDGAAAILCMILVRREFALMRQQEQQPPLA